MEPRGPSATTNVSVLNDEFYHLQKDPILLSESQLYEPGNLWKRTVSKGEILYSLVSDKPDTKCTLTKKSVFIGALTEIGIHVFNLFLAISSTENRMEVHKDLAWIQEGLDLCVQDVVLISHMPDIPEKSLGVIKYKGELRGKNGTWFGVMLVSKELKGKGASNGKFRMMQYFHCEPNCGLFVSLYRIRKCNHPRPLDVSTFDKPTSFNTTVQSRLIAVPLKVGERVVWMSDHGPKMGTAKYIGPLPDSKRPNAIFVGVDFDEAIGKGCGRYKGHTLFTAKPNHASIVPIVGLMKASEFTGDMSGWTRISEPLSEGKHVVGSYDRRLLGDNSSQSFQGPQTSETGQTLSILSSVSEEETEQTLTPSIIPDVIQSHKTSSSGSSSPKDDSDNSTLLYQSPDVLRLDIGSRVQVLENPPRYGVIRWKGPRPNSSAEHPEQDLLAGLEMDDPDAECYTDGTFEGVKLFDSAPCRAFFIGIHKCRPVVDTN